MKKIKVSAPATVSNLVCGFDILGMAVQAPFDEIEISVSDNPGIRIRHTDHYGLPEDPAVNIAGVALQAFISELGMKDGFDVVIHKHIKPGSGIGSSAASAAGIIAAANLLMNTGLSKKDQVRLAMEGEVLASGSRHADNLAPCIFGGLTLIRDTASFDIIPLTMPEMYVTLVHPQIEVKTSYAREILPKEVPLKTAVKQWANVAGLLTGFLKGDYDLISRSMHDHIVEPVRSKLIPGYDDVMEQCREAGVLGGGISGSGPSLFMLSRDKQTADNAGVIMNSVYDRLGIDKNVYVTVIDKRGVCEKN